MGRCWCWCWCWGWMAELGWRAGRRGRRGRGSVLGPVSGYVGLDDLRMGRDGCVYQSQGVTANTPPSYSRDACFEVLDRRLLFLAFVFVVVIVFQQFIMSLCPMKLPLVIRTSLQIFREYPYSPGKDESASNFETCAKTSPDGY